MTDHKIRSGSLQFYPRKRAKKVLPSANWENIDSEKLKGFIGYKVGMASVYVKDNTEDSLTKSKRIILPATIVECPVLKIYSVRLYKNRKVMKDIVVGYDKHLKSKLKKPKTLKKIDSIEEDYDEIRVLVYSNAAEAGVSKKSSDLIELGIGGSKEEQLNLIKEKINEGFSVSEFFGEGIADIHAVTKGHGTQGPVKRFGITLKVAKAEKGQRRPGSLAPWHPARVTFRAPQAGQTGYHSRVEYNKVILKAGKISEEDINKKQGFAHYGKVKTDYLLIKGSIPGPRKRPVLITKAARPGKVAKKENYEVLDIR